MQIMKFSQKKVVARAPKHGPKTGIHFANNYFRKTQKKIHFSESESDIDEKNHDILRKSVTNRLDQIEPALEAGAHHLLLDNMDPATLRAAVAMVAGRVPTEASGGIDLTTIAAKAATGVDYVSVGRLTQSAPAADIGLDFTPI